LKSRMREKAGKLRAVKLRAVKLPVASLWAAPAAEKALDFSISYEGPETLWALGDEVRLKQVFKSAATSGSRRGPFKPIYEQLLAKGLKPDLAKLTLARRISAIALAMWKKGERFDPKKLK